MGSYAVQFTLKSRNAKVGAMPVSTTTAITCPDACALKVKGCYAESGPLGMLWRALSNVAAGGAFKHGGNLITSMTWKSFTAAISALPNGTLWRHNQAGDLPGQNDKIDGPALAELVAANQGKRGFTYSHKPLTGPHGARNAAAIRAANRAGFTINLSADTLPDADTLSDAGIGPVVVILPSAVSGNVTITTPAGRRVTVCPATYRDEVSCKSCELCQRQNRAVIVGFPAHGTFVRAANAVAIGA